MESNQATFNHYQTTFKEVAVVLEDDNQVLMKKCLNCGFIVRNHSFSKLNHWKNCPIKWFFKYDNQKETERSFSAICLICHLRITTTTYLDMLNHYNTKCRFQLQGITNNSPNPNDILTQYDGQPDDVQFFHESVVSQREIDGQRKLYAHNTAYALVPGFKCKYQPSSHGLERIGECQQCLKTWKKPASKNLIAHRNVCPLPTQLLLTVSTQSTLQPFDMTISSSMPNENDGNYTFVEKLNKKCFICDTTVSESFVSLYDTLSKHSQTQIFEFVWKFLDNHPSVRDDSIDAANSDWSSICANCLDKINQYDLACETANKLEHELRNVLSHTEASYTNQQNVIRQTEELCENDVFCNEDNQIDMVVNVDPEHSARTEIDNEGRCIIELSDDGEENIENTYVDAEDLSEPIVLSDTD
ncbi:uncharacterized protein LOC116350129 [Contarinia nasturtii]|uniref:uncharacterized protein LOC116350129 n=1 Tax=Contarinia nasturtii TaxID=265458 RepID=UPI0012D3F084|nr:uncharacterized protein LOC116350129 [Contarinia nasturtii]